MQNLTTRERYKKYLIHLGLSFIVPLLFVFISIAISGSREEGMGIGIAVAFLSLNIFYAFIFFKASNLINIICGIIITIITIGLTWLVAMSQIKPSFDFYGVYTLIFSYGLFSILSWEGAYHILKRKLNIR